MTSHVSDEFPKLLTGEASRADVHEVAAHLRHCDDCRQELVSAVVAHASLTSARRVAPEVVTRPASAPADSGKQLSQLPDLSAVFAQVRKETETASGRPVHRPRGARYLAAAAAGVLIGGGAVALVQQLGAGPPSGRTVALAPYDHGTTSAEATFLGTEKVRLDAASLPALDAKHRYEVWLTNAARTAMQPVGWLGSNGKADLTVPSDLLNRYTDLEVSVQQVDAPTYTYSGTSVLRGSYG